jgi:hypothetical protein
VFASTGQSCYHRPSTTARATQLLIEMIGAKNESKESVTTKKLFFGKQDNIMCVHFTFSRELQLK